MTEDKTASSLGRAKRLGQIRQLGLPGLLLAIFFLLPQLACAQGSEQEGQAQTFWVVPSVLANAEPAERVEPLVGATAFVVAEDGSLSPVKAIDVTDTQNTVVRQTVFGKCAGSCAGFSDSPACLTCATPACAAPIQQPTACGCCGDSGCGQSGCCGGGGCCGDCGSLCGCDCCRPRYWARVDLLLWNMSGYSVPALATGSPAGTPANAATLLGQPTTNVLFGNEDIGDGFRVGSRVRAGWWFDSCRKVGLQGDFFAFANNSDSATFSSDADGFLGRPFINTNPTSPGADAQLIGAPGLSNGSLRFDTSSDVVSFAPAMRFNLCCCQDPCKTNSTRTDFLLGYRFFRLQEEFASQEILNVTDPFFVPGTNYQLNDRIRTQNDFHGVEFGLSRQVQRDRWRFGLDTLFALGNIRRVVDLDGSTVINIPGFGTQRSPGGFLVGPNQIGRFEDNEFAVIPQVRAEAGYCLGNNWRVHAGYTFMYLGSVIRPGQFLNTNFDGALLGQDVDVDTVRSPNFRKDTLFLHGANVGLTYNF